MDAVSLRCRMSDIGRGSLAQPRRCRRRADSFVFDRAPQPLDKDVVAPGALECGAVVPSGSSCHLHSFVPATLPDQERKIHLTQLFRFLGPPLSWAGGRDRTSRWLGYWSRFQRGGKNRPRQWASKRGRGRPQPAPMMWSKPYRGKDHAASSARRCRLLRDILYWQERFSQELFPNE